MLQDQKTSDGRSWISRKLDNKGVLVAVCAVILVPATAFLFWPPGPEKVKISSVPSGAEVVIDGKKKKNTTDFEFTLAPGDHIVRVSLPGYQPKEMEFVVKPSTKNETIQLKLEPDGGKGKSLGK